MKRYKIKYYKGYKKRLHKGKIITATIFVMLASVIILGYTRLSWGTESINKIRNINRRSANSTENKLDASIPLIGYMEAPYTDYSLYKDPTQVKGIYVSGNRAGSKQGIDQLISLCNRTEINAMVIDVKTDEGHVTFSMNDPLIQRAGAIPSTVLIQDIHYLMEQLYENDIYPIARIITFKDNVIKNTYPEYVLRNKDGSFYQSNEPGGKKTTWLNPYNQDVWKYILSIAKQAVQVGFKEIQFDYIRFHEGTSSKNVDFGKEAENKSKIEIISEFTKYVANELHKEEVYVSVDVFGAIITSRIDAEIVGQDYVEMSKYVDYICPMVYPSHYSNGSFGIQYPDLDPYSIILNAMEISSDLLKTIPKEEHRAIIRPWLQDFTATWVPEHQKYGPKQIREQIEGVYDAGLQEWLLWSASNRYTEDGLLAK